ncbi:MAG: DNA polymerase/3'-5' exonuclease PolX [Nanoarchaeota archaeon]|nr:DNA polymerase/3'-5' exonuclease PolX [Nanoarchaeota archaeon]
MESLSEDIEDIYKRGELEEISGVGKHIAEKITEFIETGKLKYYDKLKKEVKIDIEELNKIPGLGSKKIKILYNKLKIKNLKDLEAAIKRQKLRELSGFSEKTEQSLLEGINIVKSRPHRFLYSQVIPLVKEIKETFERLNFVKAIEVAGSFRRRKETIGDLDFLVVSKEPGKVRDVFTSLPDIKQVLAKGLTKSSIRLNNNLQVDLRVVKEKEFGSALLYFIGNKQHNVELRKFALKKGYTLSEYGLFKLKDNQWVAGRTEEEVYKKLGLQYIPPEIRGNQGEIQAAQNNKIPKLIDFTDVKGIFHNHTKWSDGNNSIPEVVKKAEEMKLKFISFNDHFSSIGITNPLNEARLKKYLQELEKVRKKSSLRVFSGVEIDILKDGTLPLEPKKLKELDVVIAAVHTSTKMSPKEMTARVCKALKNYPINILAHPTDRLIGEREPLKMNLEKVFETAKENDVFLEINSSPKRMDLSGENVRSALNSGCKFAISTDAHNLSQMDAYPLGVNLARRGWVESKKVLNCWSMQKVENALKK